MSLRKIRKNDIHHKYKSTHLRVQMPNDRRKKWYFQLRRSREEKTLCFLTSNINVNVSSVTHRRVKKHWALYDNRYFKKLDIRFFGGWMKILIREQMQTRASSLGYHKNWHDVPSVKRLHNGKMARNVKKYEWKSYRDQSRLWAALVEFPLACPT